MGAEAFADFRPGTKTVAVGGASRRVLAAQELADGLVRHAKQDTDVALR